MRVFRALGLRTTLAKEKRKELGAGGQGRPRKRRGICGKSSHRDQEALKRAKKGKSGVLEGEHHKSLGRSFPTNYRSGQQGTAAILAN